MYLRFHAARGPGRVATTQQKLWTVLYGRKRHGIATVNNTSVLGRSNSKYHSLWTRCRSCEIRDITARAVSPNTGSIGALEPLRRVRAPSEGRP